MIDTLKIGLSDYEVVPKNKVIVQPSPYRVDTGELLSNFDLWVDNDTGEMVQGSKGYYNDEKMNVTLSPYGGETMCHVQLSVPKYFHGSNYFPVDKEGTVKVLNNLEERLGGVGIKTNLDKAHISRIDTFKTIVAEENFNAYTGVFNLLRAKRTHKRDYGTTFLWFNGEREVCVYDKIEELRLNGEDVSKLPSNSVRFEYRLKKPRKIRNVLSFDTVGDLKREYGRLMETFIFSMSSDLFKYKVGDIEVLCGNVIEDTLKTFKKHYGGYYRSKFLKAVGLLKLLEMANYNTIQDAFCNVLDNRMSKTRIVRELEQARMDSSFLLQDKGSIKTYAQLYEELRVKVLQVA